MAPGSGRRMCPPNQSPRLSPIVRFIDLDLHVVRFIVGLILPGHYNPGEQRLFKVLSEGLGNEDKAPCPRSLLPPPADLNRGPDG